MKVEAVTPEDYMGDVMGDLNRRRGLVQGMEDAPAGKVIPAPPAGPSGCSPGVSGSTGSARTAFPRLARTALKLTNSPPAAVRIVLSTMSPP